MSDGVNINDVGVPAAVESSSGVNNPANPLADLEDVVAAAQQEATVAKSPVDQFAAQFGSVVTPPVAETPSSSVAQAVDQNPSPTIEVVSQPEQTPAEKLKKQIAASVDEFLEEVTKEETAV